jgi:hypothetical protein
MDGQFSESFAASDEVTHRLRGDGVRRSKTVSRGWRVSCWW